MLERLSSLKFPCFLGWFCAILSVVCAGQTRPTAPEREVIHYRGRVFNRSTGKTLDAAYISFVPHKHPAWRTDSAGRFSLWTSEKSDRVQIGHEGYKLLSLTTKDGALHRVQLEPAPAAGLDEVHLAISPTVQLLTPSQFVAPAIVTAESAPELSGSRQNWSPWYRLRVGNAPAEYAIHHDEFWLSGDRTCGLSAECRQISRNDQEVVWEFRLQGHSEKGAPSKTYSAGHLRVVYRHEKKCAERGTVKARESDLSTFAWLEPPVAVKGLRVRNGDI